MTVSRSTLNQLRSQAVPTLAIGFHGVLAIEKAMGPLYPNTRASGAGQWDGPVGKLGFVSHRNKGRECVTRISLASLVRYAGCSALIRKGSTLEAREVKLLD